MANSSTNVVVAAPITGGGALVAPIGTSLPTSLTTTLDATFAALGYLSDNGVVEQTNRASKKQFAWGGDTIATTQDSYGKSFKFTIAEYLSAVAKSVTQGAANVTVTAASSTSGTKITARDTSAQLPLNSWVFEIVSGPARIRKVIPSARVSDLGDIDFKSTDISGQEITLDAYPDANGVYVYTYTDDGVFSA